MVRRTERHKIGLEGHLCISGGVNSGFKWNYSLKWRERGDYALSRGIIEILAFDKTGFEEKILNNISDSIESN